MPETISTSETSSAQPPVSRIILAAAGPSAGLPMASERAMVLRALRLDVVSALLDRVRDGRAAGGLRAEEADRLVFDQAEVDELVEGLADLADERAAGHGDDDVVGQTPAELLGDLVADGLRAFGVVGAQVHVDEAPVVLVGDQRAEAVDVVVVAVDADQARAVDLGVEDLGGLEVGGDEDAGLEAEARGLRGDGVGEIAGGGAADGRRSRTACALASATETTRSLKLSVGKADGVVLDVEIGGADALAEILGADERREAYGKVGLEALGDGQQRGVAPDVGRAGGDGLAGEDAADGFEVVGDLERGEAVGAGGERLVAEALAALVALQLVAGYRNSP